MTFHVYSGTPSYIAGDDLQQAVNVALALGRPLLIRGEPGTGKTLLAHSVAETLERRERAQAGRAARRKAQTTADR